MASEKDSTIKQFTIVVPCKNEEKTIEKLYKDLKSAGYEILIPIAKSSSDSTVEICKSNSIPYFIDSGKGKGSGLIESLDIVKTKYLVFFDADGSHETDDIALMLNEITKKDCDMVIGSRLLGGSLELYDGSFESFLRMFFTLMINQIINFRFRSKITDSQNGFRVAKVDSLKSLKLSSSSFEIETEMIMKMLKRNMKISEIPSREYERKFGKSGVSLVKHGWRYVLCILKNLL